jgi:methylenetetrahydrofolate reductase (NADPH)
MERQLWNAVETLAPVAPAFMSVTYGAGGSTRERTHAVVSRIQNDFGVPAAAHLTCVNATRDEIDAIADAYWQAGIRHIVALRGDPPGGIDGEFVPTPGGYAYANELVAGLLNCIRSRSASPPIRNAIRRPQVLPPTSMR